jgi:LPS-assembly lipoprotein
MIRIAQHVILLVLVFVLAACSYRPLYGEASGGDNVARDLSGLTVQEQRNRAGQLVRSELLSSNAEGENRYSLSLTVTEKSVYVARLPGKVTERYRLRLAARYELKDVSSGEIRTKGSSQSFSSYDTVREPIADLQARNKAVESAALELAQDLKLRLAAALTQ